MGQTVYGFALADPGTGQLRFIQRFDDDDIVPLESGGRISLLPTLTLTSAACSSMMVRLVRGVANSRGDSMPYTTQFSLSGCKATCDLLELRLRTPCYLYKFGSFDPTPTTALADFTAQMRL